MIRKIEHKVCQNQEFYAVGNIFGQVCRMPECISECVEARTCMHKPRWWIFCERRSDGQTAGGLISHRSDGRPTRKKGLKICPQQTHVKLMLTNSKTDHLFIDKGTLTTSFPLPVNYIKSNFANCKMPKIVYHLTVLKVWELRNLSMNQGQFQ